MYRCFFSVQKHPGVAEGLILPSPKPIDSLPSIENQAGRNELIHAIGLKHCLIKEERTPIEMFLKSQRALSLINYPLMNPNYK